MSGPHPRFGEARTLLFGIGAQKCGTTWLYHYLRGHPEVHLARAKKELHYWSTIRPPHHRAARRWRAVWGDADGRALARALRGREADHASYAQVLFSGRGAEAVVGEITPAYALLGPETFAEMAALGRDVRFVFVMRDPVARLISGLSMAAGRGAGGIEALLARALDGDPGQDLARSRYEATLAALDAAVAPERAGLFFYETLFEQGEVDRLTDFLGVGRWPAEVDRRVLAGAAAEVSEAGLRAAEAALAPTYAALRARFGDGLPAAWRDPGRP